MSQALPHHYIAHASGGAEGVVNVSGRNTPELECAPPIEFGGPGDLWSPEELLLAAVANCFVLSFRAIARASRLEWSGLACDVQGTLDKAEGGLQFTRLEVSAQLTLTDATQKDKAARLLEKAEQSCLITNSLKSDCQLNYDIVL